MSDERGFKRVARWAMVVFMVASGIGHFAITDAYVAMVPASFPSPRLLVYASGVAELAGGLGLVVPWPRLRRAAAFGIIALLVAVFPANINMAVHHISPPGMHIAPAALWARLPFQALFVAWAWWLARPSRA
ncbi:MAG TPA: DoxX family membrane protein [Polyangia bacterium]